MLNCEAENAFFNTHPHTHTNTHPHTRRKKNINRLMSLTSSAFSEGPKFQKNGCEIFFNVSSMHYHISESKMCLWVWTDRNATKM